MVRHIAAKRLLNVGSLGRKGFKSAPKGIDVHNSNVSRYTFNSGIQANKTSVKRTCVMYQIQYE